MPIGGTPMTWRMPRAERKAPRNDAVRIDFWLGAREVDRRAQQPLEVPADAAHVVRLAPRAIEFDRPPGLATLDPPRQIAEQTREQLRGDERIGRRVVRVRTQHHPAAALEALQKLNHT